MNLKRFTPSFGAPEMSLIGAGVSNLAKYYNMPCLISSRMTDSKTIDMQTAYEGSYR